MSANRTWQDIVADKQARQKAAIPTEWILKDLPGPDVLDVSAFPETCGLLSAADIAITNAPVEELLPKLASGAWSAYDVTLAFYKRAIIAHQLTNCLTEIFVEQALARAKEVDEYFKTTGKPIGPLHGLPVSLKDQINIKGIESSMGYVSWLGIYPEKDAVLTDILKSLGAIPFVKTNIPQTLMWPETFNLIFGRTSNPHNRTLTCGGSSGGEGALVALKGSPLGVGSDLGGSVRIPAAFCGTYGFRPSYSRIPYGGCVNSAEGQDSVLSVLGPLANSLAGVKAFMQGVVSAKPWLKDPLVVRKEWSEKEYGLVDHGEGKGLCIAVMWDDGGIVPHPPVLRGLETAKKALEAAGHKVIDWKPYKHAELNQCLFEIWAAGGKEDYAAVASLTGEPVLSTMSIEQARESEATYLVKDEGVVSAYKLWQVQKRRRDLRQEYLAHWNATVSETGTGRPVDAILCPSAPYVAPPHGQNKYITYTCIWNALDYPAAILPVSKVDPQLDTKRPPHQFRNDDDESHYNSYDPAVFANAPITVQLVGRTQEEEAVVAMAEILDAALKAKK